MKLVREHLNEHQIPDLTPYDYDKNPKQIDKNELAIGWLDGPDFPRGKVPEGFLEKLDNARTIERHKGWHDCPFCPVKSGVSGPTKSSTVLEIESGKKRYVFPGMLKHYIEKHKYLPPQEFIDTVMATKDEDKPMYHFKQYRNPHGFKR